MWKKHRAFLEDCLIPNSIFKPAEWIEESLQHCWAPSSSGQAHRSFPFLSSTPFPPPPSPLKKENQLRSTFRSPSLLTYLFQGAPSISFPLLQCQEAPSHHLYLVKGAPQKSFKTNISTKRRALLWICALYRWLSPTADPTAMLSGQGLVLSPPQGAECDAHTSHAWTILVPNLDQTLCHGAEHNASVLPWVGFSSYFRIFPCFS